MRPSARIAALWIAVAPSMASAQESAAPPRNVILILADDHRYDALGFLGHPFLETPHMDSLASGGVYLPNAFVTTSLCSPSRASILTGQYMHHHGVVDNNNPVRPGTRFFCQDLQESGYQTAFVGKWHMGGSSDAPRPGFDHWVSFRGQGNYYPNENTTLNVNGTTVPQKGYITDELTDYALEWLNTLSADQPFFLYLSHKAVHDNFSPAERHRGLYAEVDWQPPITMANSEENYHHKPLWTKNQRNSWHGVDFSYHSTEQSIEKLYKSYCEALLAVDDSVGRILDWLRENNQLEQTLLLYMGDNGFLWGEHGLIDKRNAYEESMRIPLLAYAPGLLPAGSVVQGVVANIDIAPTILAAAGLEKPEAMDGDSWLQLAAGRQPLSQWRPYLLYEYYWEYNFPHTPTVFALRGPRFKFIQYHGIWDLDELYDLQADPFEQHNLVLVPEHQDRVRQMRADLFAELQRTGGDQIPLAPKRGHGARLRHATGAEVAEFPLEWIRGSEN